MYTHYAQNWRIFNSKSWELQLALCCFAVSSIEPEFGSNTSFNSSIKVTTNTILTSEPTQLIP